MAQIARVSPRDAGLRVIALENLRGRLNLAVGIGPAGLSQDMECAPPAIVEAAE